MFNSSNSPETAFANPVCSTTKGIYSVCDPSSITDGTIKCVPDNSAQCGGRPIEQCTQVLGCMWGSDGCRSVECQDFGDNQSCSDAKCTWSSGVCGPVSQSAWVTLSICVDGTTASCTNEKCSVMLCGYKSLSPAPPPSSSDWNDGTAQPAPIQQSGDAMNLYGTSCTFKAMTPKTYNSVRNSRGTLWANAFRFGVGDSFADFEKSRFFFPLSDAFCTGTAVPGQRDRFVVYANAVSTWCSQVDSYYTCSENHQNFYDYGTCTGYCRKPSNCMPASGTGYLCKESGLVYSGSQSACKSACNIVQNPKSCPIDDSGYPFLQSDSRYKMDAYGVGIDYVYYKNLLETQYDAGSGGLLQDYECESASDCLSGFCDRTYHRRGLCVNASDPIGRIDCGCQVVQTADGSTSLDCATALSGYEVYRSTVGSNVLGHAQGDYNYAGGTWLFNPYYSTADSHGHHRENEWELITDGVLFSNGKSNNPGNIGDNNNMTYRFYVLADGQATPPKIFENCAINRTAKAAIYAAYSGSGKFWGTEGVPAAESDGLGPGPAFFCAYQFDLSLPNTCSGNRDEYYMNGLYPYNGGCPKLENEGPWSDTGKLGCRDCLGGDPCKSYSAPAGSAAKYWVYELSFDGTNNRIGDCQLSSSTRPPFVKASDIGWCEGCTYSTLASNDALSADSQKMSTYLQANVMPIIDSQSDVLGEHYEAPYTYCARSHSYWKWVVYRFVLRTVCDEYKYVAPVQYTTTASYDLCKAASGAAIYVVSNLSASDGIADRSAPSAASPNRANGAADQVMNADPLLRDYLGSNALLDSNGHTLYMNNYAAALWKSQLLKDGCTNAPMTSIFLDGYYNRLNTTGQAGMDALIGNSTTPGTLFRFFYSQSMLALKEAPLESRIAKAQPDTYPNNIDILAQEWYPMCDAGTGPDAIKIEIEARTNFSRALLFAFGKPSIVTKFHFPAGTSCDPAAFLDYMFRHKGDLVDAGITGLVYDHWGDGEGKLDDLSIPDGRAGTPFCAVQNASKQVMGLTPHTYGQKIIAENVSCECQLCDAAAYGTGTCIKTLPENAPLSEVQSVWCNDASPCQMPVDSNGVSLGYTNYSRYYCPALCANLSATELCAGSPDSISCRIDTIYSSYKTLKGVSGLSDTYWNLIAALPPQDKCFLVKNISNDIITYTYAEKQSVSQRSEVLQFPRRGDAGLDCGRTPDTSFLTYCGVDIPVNNEETTCFRVG